jgi:hypothetical protein
MFYINQILNTSKKFIRYLGRHKELGQEAAPKSLMLSLNGEQKLFSHIPEKTNPKRKDLINFYQLEPSISSLKRTEV